MGTCLASVVHIISAVEEFDSHQNDFGETAIKSLQRVGRGVLSLVGNYAEKQI